MVGTGVPVIHSLRIPLQVNETMTLVPFGDVHRDSGACAVEKWHEFLDNFKKIPRAYLLGMGDYNDFLSTSERKAMAIGEYHESSIDSFEKMAINSIRTFAKELAWAKGKVIGLLEGNHYFVFPDGTTSTQRLCQILNENNKGIPCRYLGQSGFIVLYFSRHGSCGKTDTHIDVWAHHGIGAAQTVGGSANKVQEMARTHEADIYLMGHDHKKGVNTQSRLRVVQNLQTGEHEFRERRLVFGRTGSFLRSYQPGKASYVVDKAWTPSDLGAISIAITLRREYKGQKGKTLTDRCFTEIHASI